MVLPRTFRDAKALQLLRLYREERIRLLKINTPVLVGDRELMEEALALALGRGQAVYGCLYVAEAVRRGCHMVTADQKFDSAISATFPPVLSL